MADLFDKTPARGKGARKKPAQKRPGAVRGAGGSGGSGQKSGYSARDIEVLEGLEPVRRRPGMYIGGTDERALHHLAAEVLDNAMDEAVAGHASWISVSLDADGSVSVQDNGRGIPVDPHPRDKKKSAVEVILTTLHSGAKFDNKVYNTSGGLHGVGVSVVNALSDRLRVEVARDRTLWRQDYARGKPKGKLAKLGPAKNRRGTLITFHPDPNIFGAGTAFKPARLYAMARAKAYLFSGVEIRWQVDRKFLVRGEETPEKDTLHFPGGLGDYLATLAGDRGTVTEQPFCDDAQLAEGAGHVEWAITWPLDEEGSLHSFCNTVPTPDGGSHESGLRSGLMRGLKRFGVLTKNRKAAQITADDVADGAEIVLSLFIRDPLFQGQTKERLAMPDAQKLIESTVGDHFEHWLSDNRRDANDLLEHIIRRAEARRARRETKDLARKTATRKVRLPGKLADCSSGSRAGTEIFLVEGDSAGGSAKQARRRETQAILPLRGKILNVASATKEKQKANQEIQDLLLALGCGTGDNYREDNLRYDRVVIMTDADVDGAHIASLLMTFFYQEMPQLILDGHLYLAMPPLYRLSRGGVVAYAHDDRQLEKLMKTTFKGAGKVEVSRFKGLGEMAASQLKETTMDPANRNLIRVCLPDKGQKGESAAFKETVRIVESLMGRKPELRLRYLQDHALSVEELDI
ncbi:MAG: DNA topoisomerase IV subunit B [Alphaproteobacteria bacterium]